jgi:hypothetical protein
MVTDKTSSDYDNYYNVPNKPEGINVYQYQQITENLPKYWRGILHSEDTLKQWNIILWFIKGNISDIQLKFNGAKTDLVDNKIEWVFVLVNGRNSSCKLDRR